MHATSRSPQGSTPSVNDDGSSDSSIERRRRSVRSDPGRVTVDREERWRFERVVPRDRSEPSRERFELGFLLLVVRPPPLLFHKEDKNSLFETSVCVKTLGTRISKRGWSTETNRKS